jgi:hypothetical protein
MPEVREFAHSSASCLASRSGSAIAADSVRCGHPNMPQTGRRNCPLPWPTQGSVSRMWHTAVEITVYRRQRTPRLSSVDRGAKARAVRGSGFLVILGPWVRAPPTTRVCPGQRPFGPRRHLVGEGRCHVFANDQCDGLPYRRSYSTRAPSGIASYKSSSCAWISGVTSSKSCSQVGGESHRRCMSSSMALTIRAW